MLLIKEKNDPSRFITTTNVTEECIVATGVTYAINQGLIDEESKYDGYYVLSTNLTGNIEDILKITKGRWEIEESFRIMKSDFLARPVNLSREDRIKSHFLTCFIALLIYRILEKKLDYKYTTKEMLSTLRSMNVLEHKGLGYEPTYERTNITNKYEFYTDTEIISYKKMKNIFTIISK